MKKLTNKEVEERLKKVNPELTIDFDTYTSTSKKCRFVDPKYGEFWCKPSGILNGRQRGHPAGGAEARKKTCQEKYGCDSPMQSPKVQEKIKQTMQKKYGVDHPMHSKAIKEKIRNTCQKKYGCDNPTQNKQVRRKTEETNKRRYGGVAPLQNEQVKAKLRKTNQKKYGVDYTTQDPQTREKMEQTNKQRYGVENPFFSPIIQQKMHDKWRELYSKRLSNGQLLMQICEQAKVPIQNAYRIFEIYGEQVFLDYVNNHEQAISALELRFIELMKPEFDLQHYNQRPAGIILDRRPDFKLTNQGHTVYINLDGLYWHSDKHIRNKNYHMEMSKAFRGAGLRLLQFREDEVQNRSNIVKSIILNALHMTTNRINARDTKITDLTPKEARSFLDQNHLMGFRRSTKHYGICHENQIIAVMSTTYSAQTQTLEIDRFATANNTLIRGGFGKLLSHAKHAFNPTTVVSFCDLRYATGNSYTAVGFQKQSSSLGWNWTNGKQTFNRLQCRANMDDRKLSQKEHSEELKWYKIYDAGQAKYIQAIKLD